MRRLSVFLLLVLLPAACKRATVEPKTVRVAVIGGMVMTGMWEKLSAQFEKDTGLKVEVAVCGNKEVIGPAFREGVADLAAFFERIHDPGRAGVADAQTALQNGDAGTIALADDFNALFDQLFVRVVFLRFR